MRLTKTMLFKNSSKLNVRQMVFERCDQFGTAFKLALICLAVRADMVINHSCQRRSFAPAVSPFVVAQASAENFAQIMCYFLPCPPHRSQVRTDSVCRHAGIRIRHTVGNWCVGVYIRGIIGHGGRAVGIADVGTRIGGLRIGCIAWRILITTRQHEGGQE